MKKVVILGGTSGFGRWTAEFIYEKISDIYLIITGTDAEQGEKIAKQLKCEFSTDNVKAVQNADVVIVSVPISITESMINQIGPYLKPGCVLVDVTSVKQGPAKVMNKFKENGVIVLPAHPVFGPFVKNIAGQIIVFTPDQDMLQTAEFARIKNFMENQGARIVITSPKQHDKHMSIVQGITHYCLFVFGDTLRRLQADIPFSQNFVSPVYKMMISLVSRYMNQNPALYADIQMHNDENLTAQDAFRQSAADFQKYIQNQDKQAFVSNINESSKYFGPEAQRGQKYTDKIIYLLARDTQMLRDKLGKSIILENIYTKKQLTGIELKSYDHEYIYLQDGQKLDINEWIVIG